MRSILLIVAIAFAFSYACTQSNSEYNSAKARLVDIADKEHAIRCGLDSISDEVTAMWDEFNDSLQFAFAPTTNEYTRKKMLEMRNGVLLKMFRSYDSVDMSIKLHLDEVTRRDSLSVLHIEQFEKELKDLEREKMQLMMMLETDWPDSLEQVKMRYAERVNLGCE